MPTTIRHAADAGFVVGLRPFFAYRDLGVQEASGATFGAHVIRAVSGAHAEPQWHMHAVGFQLIYILNGWVEFEYEDVGRVRLQKGSSAYQPPRVRHRELGHSDDVEILEITMPGQFATELTDDPEMVAQP